MSAPAYVYCVLPGDIALPPLTGAADARTVRQGDLQAVVSAVPAIAHEGSPSLQHAEVLARVHHDVSQQVLALCTPIPLRIGTVMNDDQSVREFLRRSQSSLSETLATLQHHHEWGLKLRIDDEALARHLAAHDGHLQTLDERVTRATEGTRYLLAKQRRRILTLARNSWTDGVVQRLACLLEDCVEKWARLNPAQDEARNMAALVRCSHEQAFVDEIRRYDAALCALGTLSMTGPWPPYNFIRFQADQ